ncbi:MAG: hypothetical protein K9N51_04310 [Candidatus Pacebacteria bacterium]|nr:hypothetical protein [Candidatus Paceibacterota bacterium]
MGSTRTQARWLVLAAGCLLALVASATERLDTALEYLDADSTERRGVRLLQRLLRSRDAVEAVQARARLAGYYRDHNQPTRALTLVQEYHAYTGENLKPERYPAFLELARCLAADGRMREALKMLAYATEHSEGLDRVEALRTKGDLAMAVDAVGDAVERYEEVLTYGDRHFRPRRASTSCDVQEVKGADVWRALRPSLVEQRDRAKRAWDIQRYGEDFVYYRLARRYHLNSRWEEAFTAYDVLIRMFGESVYAEAARYYREVCRYPMGSPREASRSLNRFVQNKPLGLYRGEALFTLGRRALDNELDLRRARKYFSDLLRWTDMVRRRDEETELYMVPDKAVSVTMPPQAPLHLREGQLVDAELTPPMVINRKTAPWYLSRLDWQAAYYMGFFAFVEEDYRRASAYFQRAFKANKALQEQHKTSMGSLYRRLQIACKSGCLVCHPEELVAFKGTSRTIILLADFHAIQGRWERAEALYSSILSDSSHYTKAHRACALRGLAELAVNRNQAGKAETLYRQIVDEYPRTPSVQFALLWLGTNGSQEWPKKLELLQRAHRSNPRSYAGEKALFLQSFILHRLGRGGVALHVLRGFTHQYPRSRHCAHARAMMTEMQTAREGE